MKIQFSRLQTITFIYLLSIGMAVLAGDVITLSLFIDHLGADFIPLALLLDALLRLTFANVYAYLHEKEDQSVLLLSACAITSLGIIVGQFFIDIQPGVGYMLLFLVHRLIAAILTFYAIDYGIKIFSETHSRQQLIRLFVSNRAFLSLLGLLIIPLAFTLSQSGLINLWLASIVFCAVMIIAFSYQHLEQTPAALPGDGTDKKESPTLIPFRSLFKPGLLRWLALSTIGAMILISLLLYQSVKVLDQFYEHYLPLLVFLIVIQSVGNWLSLPLQYRLMTALFRQSNAGQFMIVFPVLLGLTLLGLIAFPYWVMVALAEMNRKPFLQGIYGPLERLLYHALPSGSQQWARQLINDIVTPLSQVAAAGLIFLAVLIGSTDIVLFITGTIATGVFIAAARQAGQTYRQTLASSLEAGHYWALRQTAAEWQLGDTTLVNELLLRLRKGELDEEDTFLAAEVIAESHTDEAYQELLDLWETTNDLNLERELLGLIVKNWPEKHQEPDIADLIDEALNSEEPTLRYAALELIQLFPNLDPEYRVASFLIDPKPEVSILAAIVLMRHPAEQIRQAARAQLRWLAKDNKAHIRVKAVSALVESSVNIFGEITAPLDIELYLSDPATRVRQAILPAVSSERLVEVTCDPSPSVQRAAALELRRRIFTGNRELLDQAVANTMAQLHINNTFQIETTLRYWRLLSASVIVRRHTRHLSLYDTFNRGFEEIDFLDTLIHTLQDMEYTVLKHLVRQLEQDRQILVDSMIGFLQAASRSERQVGAIVWTFRHSHDPREQERAYQSLQNLLNPIHARQLREAIQPVTRREKRIQTILPRIVWETLLEQQDEWRPLLTLYALASLKEIQGNTDEIQLGLKSDAVQEVLERTDQSKYDVIRESSRFIRDLLEARVDKPTIDEAGLIHHQHQDLEGEVMLSTLERMLFLRDVSFFANLRLDQLRALARVCEEHSFPEDKTLIRQGDSGDGLYILVEGRVRVERRQTEGDDSVTVATLDAPEVVGEISLLDGGVRTADVISETPVLLLHVKRATLDNALEDDPSIAMTMMRAMAQRLRMVTESFDTTSPEPASPNDKPIEEFVQNI